MAERMALGLREAAEAIGLSHWTLRKMISKGELRVVRINRRILIEPDTLRDLIQRHRKPPEGSRNQ